MVTFIKYKKLFGVIRILLGILFLIYPLMEFLKGTGEKSMDHQKWLFALFFFLLYAVSAVKNGIHELRNVNPSFDLLRFFEASMNGFIALYLVIVTFAIKSSFFTSTVLLLLVLILILSLVRDLRILSLQYYERRQQTRNGRK